MVSGLMILAFKPFVIGDVVRCVDNNITGVVEEITLRHTAIRTYENKRLIIPNSVMNSSIIENADYQDSRVCTFLEIGVTYESDIARAKELLADVVARQPDFMDTRTPQQIAQGAPLVQVVVLALAESAVTLRASLWARDNGTAFSLKCAVLEEIKAVYDREGIALPIRIWLWSAKKNNRRQVPRQCRIKYQSTWQGSRFRSSAEAAAFCRLRRAAYTD